LTARKRAADDRAAISLGYNVRSARAAGGHHEKTLRIIIDPKANRITYVVNHKTSTGLWKPLFNAKLYPLLMAELDAMKALRPRGRPDAAA
jgi:hypothetical protein